MGNLTKRQHRVAVKRKVDFVFQNALIKEKLILQMEPNANQAS